MGRARCRVSCPARFAAAIATAAQRRNVSSALLSAQIYAESGFNPFAVSPAGAQGIAQFQPGPTDRAPVRRGPLDRRAGPPDARPPAPVRGGAIGARCLQRRAGAGGALRLRSGDARDPGLGRTDSGAAWWGGADRFRRRRRAQREAGELKERRSPSCPTFRRKPRATSTARPLRQLQDRQDAPPASPRPCPLAGAIALLLDPEPLAFSRGIRRRLRRGVSVGELHPPSRRSRSVWASPRLSVASHVRVEQRSTRLPRLRAKAEVMHRPDAATASVAADR